MKNYASESNKWHKECPKKVTAKAENGIYYKVQCDCECHNV